MRTRSPHPRRAAARFLVLAALLPLLAAACAMNPTPYQPRDANGFGYEQSRLQERVWRVSFRANRYTPETEVLDDLYLRCAELTRESGYSAFLIEQDFGHTQVNMRATGGGMGLGAGVGSPFWGAGLGPPMPPEYESYVTYRLAIFVIRMLTPEEAKKHPNAFDAAYLLRSLGGRRQHATAHAKP